MFSLYMAERLWRYWNSLDIQKKDIMTISAAMERDISVLQSRMKITVLYYGYNAACNRVRKKKGTKHYEWDYWNWHWIFS